MKHLFFLIASLSLVSLSLMWATKKPTPISSPSTTQESMNEEKKTSVVQELTPELADQVITNVPLVIVDFYAEWCSPCKTLKPVYEQTAHELANKYVFAKANIDQCQELAAKYNISSIPTIVVFSNGQVLAKITGLMSQEALIEKIEAAVKGPQDISKLSQNELNEKLWQTAYTLEDVKELKRFIDAGAQVNFEKNGATALVMIIMNCGMRGLDATPYLELLLNAGAQTQVTDATGKVIDLADAATQMGNNMRTMAQNYDKMATVIKEHRQKSAADHKKCDGNSCQL